MPGGALLTCLRRKQGRIGSAAASTPVLETSATTKVSSGTSIDATVPAGTESGDLLVAILVDQNVSAPSTAPSGWTEDATNGNRLHVFWRAAPASPPSTYQWSWAGTGAIICIMVRISGADTSALHLSSYVEEIASSAPNCPTITTTVDKCLVLRVMGTLFDIDVGTGYPSGTTGVDKDNGDGTWAGAGLAWEEKDPAGATGAKTFSTSHTTNNEGGTIAIAPA